MTDHRNLDNVRTVACDPACAHCGTPIAELPNLHRVVTPRRDGPTFCDRHCWSDWVWAQPRQSARLTGQPISDETPLQRPVTASVARRRTSPADKGVARQAGEAAANVIGFAVWLVVISMVASVILAVWR